MKKNFICFFLLGVIFSLFSAAIWRLSDGFSLSKIQSDLSFSKQWAVEMQDESSVKDLLNQNFYYLGKGSQCYVFESEDHDVVLKFFRHTRYRLPPITRLMSLPSFLANIQNTRAAAKEKKLESLFASCLLAYQELREETGLVYLHLNKTSHLHQTVLLYDKLNRVYPIAIDDYEFLIQKRGEQIYPYLTRLIAKGKKREAQEALTDLATLLLQKVQKGIKDHDAVIHKNSGFRGKKALFLDVGGFSHTLSSNTQDELWETTDQLRAWLYKHDPRLADHFEHVLNAKATVCVPQKTPFLIKGLKNI